MVRFCDWIAEHNLAAVTFTSGKGDSFNVNFVPDAEIIAALAFQDAELRLKLLGVTK